MKSLLTICTCVLLLVACTSETPKTEETVTLSPVVVGEKNELFEVVATNRIRLAPGVKVQLVEGPGGHGRGMVLLKPNGGPGGYVACDCVQATSGSCDVTSDNRENDPVCTGGCTDSEGNSKPCIMEDMIGPPKDPKWLRFSGRK